MVNVGNIIINCIALMLKKVDKITKPLISNKSNKLNNTNRLIFILEVCFN